MIDPALADAGLGDAEDDDFDAIESYDSQLPDHRYLDRELSWLAFNQRVLELAEDPSLPELERRQLPGDLREQSRRVSSWCASPDSSAAS